MRANRTTRVFFAKAVRYLNLSGFVKAQSIKITRCKVAMEPIWQWVGSPAYWKSAALMVGFYLVVAVLGKTGDWFFSASIAFGFSLCWQFSRKNIEAKNNNLTQKNRAF